MLYLTHDKPHHTPCNKGKITGQKPPLRTLRDAGLVNPNAEGHLYIIACQTLNYFDL